jgi:hypothetical protein
VPVPSDPRGLASLQKGKDEYINTPDAGSKNEELAADKGDVTSLILKIKNATQSNWHVTEEWRESAEESYDFVENNQWSEEDAKFNKDKQAWRPMMTFNKVLPQVRLLSGMERQNREELRVFPREGGDTQDADVMTGLIKYILDENLAPWELTRKSNDVYICGRGFVKTDISHDENINGDVIIERLNPFAVFWDTMSDKWSGQDMRWIQYGPWMTEDEARELWPDFAEQIKVGDWLSENTSPLEEGLHSGDIHYQKKLFLDAETKRVRVLEHWYKQRQVVKIAVNYATGDVCNADDEKFKAQFGEGPESLMAAQAAGFDIIDRKMTCVRVATVMHWLLVQDKPSPYTHYSLPIVPYIGLQFMGEPSGLVEYMKDPQRLLNKSISQALNHLNRSANSGWKNKRNGGAITSDLEKFGSAPGIVIEWDEVEPQEIKPQPLSSGHTQLAEISSGLMEEIGLLNAEIQGTSTQKTVSGRAIEARQRGGMIGNEDFFDNQLLGDKILGYQIIANVQKCYTQERIVRILGARAVRDPEDTAAKIFTQLTNPNTTQENGDKLYQIVDRCLKAEYDYVVDRSPQSVTIRQEQNEQLVELAKQFNQNGVEIIPADLIVDGSDLPESSKARIKQQIEMARGQIAGQMAQAQLPPGKPPGGIQ